MTEALDAALTERSSPTLSPGESEPKENASDWILSEMVMNLPAGQAEAILLRNWLTLRNSDYYIAAALFFASPPLLVAVAEAVQQSDAPQDLFKYLSMRAGRTRGNAGNCTGFYQIKQIQAILPYLDYLSDSDVYHLWDTCNKHGWYSLRRQHLDGRLSEQWRDRDYLSEAKALEALDEHLKHLVPMIDHWVDRCLETGWTLDRMFDLVARWCAEKKTMTALEILASALIHAGKRMHILLTKIEEIVPADEADAISSDTAYAVMRRTLV